MARSSANSLSILPRRLAPAAGWEGSMLARCAE